MMHSLNSKQNQNSHHMGISILKEFEVRSASDETTASRLIKLVHILVILLLYLFQVKLKEMKPGHLSQELKDALGMPEGAPPPWLINMQV